MNSICFFASFFPGNKIPYYIQFYLLELKKHFNEVVLLASNQSFDNAGHLFLTENNIKLQIEKNEGFDFGLWYKAFQKYDVKKYNKIALVNDSCILVTSLDKFIAWSDKNDAEYIGISESLSVSRHLQSYFIIIKEQAISHVFNYFSQTGILPTIKDVISKYEIGLSTYLLNKGIKINSYIDNKGYSGEFSPYYYLIEDQLQQNVPLIKRKIIFSSYRKDELFTLARMNFKINPEYYIGLIKKYNSSDLIDFVKVKADFKNGMSFWDSVIYNVKRVLIQFVRPIYKRIK